MGAASSGKENTAGVTAQDAADLGGNLIELFHLPALLEPHTDSNPTNSNDRSHRRAIPVPDWSLDTSLE